MQLLENLRIFDRTFVQLFRMLAGIGAECLCLQQLIYQAVAFGSHLGRWLNLYDIKGDGGGHSQHKGFLRHSDFASNFLNRGAFTEYLNDSIAVQTVHFSYSAYAYEPAPLHTQAAHGTLNGHDFGKACSLQDAVHLGLDIGNPEPGKPFGQG